jgi:ribosomal protein L40E
VIFLVKFPEADARIFKNTFVCRRCKTKVKTTAMQVRAGKISCRKCGARALRVIRKK